MLSGARFDNSIGLGAWGTEWHSAETNESEFQLVAAYYARRSEAPVAEIQAALREQGALIDGDHLPDSVPLQNF